MEALSEKTKLPGGGKKELEKKCHMKKCKYLRKLHPIPTKKRGGGMAGGQNSGGNIRKNWIAEKQSKIKKKIFGGSAT